MSNSSDTNKSLVDVNITNFVKKSEHVIKTESNDDLLWNRRLGHPTFKVVKIVLHQYDPPSFDK